MALTSSDRLDRRPALSPGRHALVLLPGLLVALTVAAAARVAAGASPVPAVFVALMLGFAIAGRVARPHFRPGLALAGRGVMRTGVALLGVQVTLAEIVGLGPTPFLFATLSVAATIAIGYPLGRAAGMEPGAALLAAGGVAICGASAVLAIAAVLPRQSVTDEQAASTIAGVTILGTVGMVLYPLAAIALGLDSIASGIFLGASLHEVVQAVGAGYSLSDRAGEVATAVKLIRVAWLAPVVVLLGWAARSLVAPGRDAPVPVLPWFLVLFIALALLSSFDAISREYASVLAEVSRWCLLVGIAALGASLSMPQMRAIGHRPALVLAAQTVIAAGITLGGILMLDIH